MVAKEELLQKFQITCCENLSDEVLEKCIELCHWYDVDEETLVDMWFAFCVEHQDGNFDVTLKALEEFKRKNPRTTELDNSSIKHQKRSAKVFNAATGDAFTDDENEILGIYATSEKLNLLTKKQQQQQQSSDPADSSAGGCKTQPVECAASLDATQSFASLQSSYLNKPVTASKVLMSIGPKVKSWTNDKKQKYVVKRVQPYVLPDERYMFELLKTTSDIRTRVCRTIGLKLHGIWNQNQNDDDMLVTWNVRTRHQQNYRTWGRVCFESEIKQANPTALLEGCRKPPKVDNADTKLWPNVELDVTALSECCLFPGQIIAVEGLNLTDSLLKVHSIYNGSFIPAAKPHHLPDELKLVVAAGPFTQSNDLMYAPMHEFFLKIAEEEPHVLILIGPFLDYAHPKIQDNSLTCTHQDFFNALIGDIKDQFTGKCTQIVLVSSSRDAHHHAVYPTPEYYLNPKTIAGCDIQAVPDPCILDIHGLRIGVTSIDCLMHIGREEVVLKPSATDKLSRLGNYILSQACFYPLYPPAKEVNVDTELWEKYAYFKEKPHLLILPSDLRYFCKYINDSIILNPERLSKRSYAKLNFPPYTGGTWTHKNISCEIIKM